MSDLNITFTTIEKALWALGLIGAVILPVWKMSFKVSKFQEQFKDMKNDIEDLRIGIKEIASLKIEVDNLSNKVNELEREIKKQKELNKRLFKMIVEAMESVPEKNSEHYEKFKAAKDSFDEYMLENI